MIKGAIRRSISRKFMLAVLVTTCSALLVSGAAMLLLDIQTFRTAWVADLTTQSNILARVSMPALEFNDQKVAKENLEQLKARPNILAAAVYAHDGTLFATYSNDDVNLVVYPDKPQANGYTIAGNQISVFTRITRNRETVGTIYLHARYPLVERISRYSIILIIVMVASLIVATAVSIWLRAAVTKPVLAVTDSVHQVIRRRDYSMRVKKTTDDEIGVLVDAFNIMLVEVGDRSAALEGSNAALQHEMKERRGAEEALRELNNTLEDRIVARTAELERVHDQLRQSQKLEAIGQLTGGVAHDFNNVLQVIAGNLQLLQMSLGDNPAAQRRLETAAFAADRGAKLSSHLLSFARRQPLKPVATNLRRIITGMDDLLRRALGESIEIESIVTGSLWLTMVDPNQIENVILNLAINARDAMNAEGKLTIELCNAVLGENAALVGLDVRAGHYVMLAVSDTGTGMAPDVLARAFEPFFTTKPDGEGTGLGLSMAYGFVKQSGGHIKIYSEPGMGTTIKIYLPRSHELEEEPHVAMIGPAIGGTETILVVEDDPAVQATAVDILTGLGYEVLMANDAQRALDVLRSGTHVDLLFTDVVMPGPIRSPDLAKQAKALLPDIEVLFTSGYTRDAIVHGGRLDAGVELISKPYRREELARKIRHVLANRPSYLKEEMNSFVSNTTGSVIESSTQDSTMPGSATESANGRILVVEDNLDAQEMLCELLMALGHDAKGVADAESALAAIAVETFDILLTDLTLPGMSGLDLARRVVATTPNLKIIFSSGYGAVSTSDFPFKSASLPKPYDIETLQRVLASVSA